MMSHSALAPLLLAAALTAIPALPAWAQREMSFSEAESEGGESLFDRLEPQQGAQSGSGEMSFDETSIAEHDALACAAGLGCEGLGVNRDDALVLTGHNTADTARQAYQEKYGEPISEGGAGNPSSSGDEANRTKACSTVWTQGRKMARATMQ